MSNIAIIGAGSYGTALASVLSENDHHIRLHVRETDSYRAIVGWKNNAHYLPCIALNMDRIYPTLNLAEAVRGAEITFLTIPAQHLREVMVSIRPYLEPETIIVLTSKGMIGKGTAMSDTARQELPKFKLCGLYGITFAEHIASNKEGFSAMCIASLQKEVHDKVANLFMQRTSDRFRIYLSNDLRGVEFGGAMKNVYAITMGMIDGFYDDDDKISRYSIMPLCTSEFIEFGLLYGAKLYTLLGPSGVGDIYACCNETSRNYQYGKWIASVELSKSVQPTKAPSLHEGYDTLSAAMELAIICKIDTPILKATHDILFESKKIKETFPKLVKKLSGIIRDTEEKKLNSLILDSVNGNIVFSSKDEKLYQTAFLSYRFVPEYEQYVNILKANSDLYDIKIETGVAEGPQPPKKGISEIVIDKIKQADLYFAIYLNVLSDSSWMIEERAIAIENNKSMLIFVEEGTPKENLGKLNSEIPCHYFTKDTFITVLNEQLQAIGKKKTIG